MDCLYYSCCLRGREPPYFCPESVFELILTDNFPGIMPSSPVGDNGHEDPAGEARGKGMCLKEALRERQAVFNLERDSE